LETAAQKGQSVIEMVIFTSALIAFLTVTLPGLFVRFDHAVREVSLTKEVVK
jgi:hypothetical protein